jgi:polyisoprenoid-binding protein YceI
MTTATLAAERGTTLWSIDPSHSHVGFGVRHLMISTVKGRFAGVNGDVSLEGGSVGTASIDVTIDAASIDTGVAQRDDHLRSADFFDVARFPTLKFEGRRIERTGKDALRVTGDLTIRDVTREVQLDVSELGRVKDPWGGERAGYSASARINRRDFGLTWNQALETGGFVVGDEVVLTLEVELVRASE